MCTHAGWKRAACESVAPFWRVWKQRRHSRIPSLCCRNRCEASGCGPSSWSLLSNCPCTFVSSTCRWSPPHSAISTPNSRKRRNIEQLHSKIQFVKSSRHKMLVTFSHMSADQKWPDKMNWYVLLHREDSGNLYYTCPHTLAGSSVSSKITSTTNRKLGIVSVRGTAASVSHKRKRHRCGPPRRSAVSVGTGVQTKGHMADRVSFGRLIQWWEANGPNRVVISARERTVPSVRD